MKTLAFNVFATIMFVGYFCLLGYTPLHLNDAIDTTTKVETTETAETTESSILQDIVISNGNYYYNGEPIFLDEDCSTLLWQILDSNISYVVPIATYVEYVDNIAIMHLD